MIKANQEGNSTLFLGSTNSNLQILTNNNNRDQTLNSINNISNINNNLTNEIFMEEDFFNSDSLSDDYDLSDEMESLDLFNNFPENNVNNNALSIINSSDILSDNNRPKINREPEQRELNNVNTNKSSNNINNSNNPKNSKPNLFKNTDFSESNKNKGKPKHDYKIKKHEKKWNKKNDQNNNIRKNRKIFVVECKKDYSILSFYIIF